MGCILRRVFCFLCCISPLASPAQYFRIDIDSLKSLVPDAKDTTQIRLHRDIALGYMYQQGSPDSLQVYATKLLEGARKLNQGLDIARGQHLLGVAALYQQNYGEAQSWFKKAYAYGEKIGDLNIQAIILNAWGNNFLYAGELEEALEKFLEVISFSDQGHTFEVIGGAYINAGIILSRLTRYEEAISYFKQGLTYTNDSSSLGNKILVYANIIPPYVRTQKLDSAWYFAQKAWVLSKQNNYQYGKNSAAIQLAMLGNKSDQYELALAYADSAMQVAGAMGNEQLLVPSMFSSAVSYDSLGNYPQAIAVARDALQAAEKYKLYPNQISLHELLSDVYEKQGANRKALYHYKMFKSLTDSVVDAEKEKRITAIQNLYEVERKERKLQVLAQTNQIQVLEIKQKNTLIWTIGIGALVAILLGIVLYRQRMLRQQQKVHEMEQRLLRAQMNPHFLFNSLASIQTFLFDNQNLDKAIFYLSKLAMLMRQVLEHSREPFITLEEEIELLENYLHLQQLRFDHKFSFAIEVDPDLEPDGLQVPPMVAQPFVENAIVHGKIHQMEEGEIKVSFQKEEGHLQLVIEDNGIGRKESQKETATHKSLASQITQERMQLLNILHGKSFSYRISDPSVGTKVTLNFPQVSPV
ncbi:MAG: histidine kinase [Bacteroidota bacterium]